MRDYYKSRWTKAFKMYCNVKSVNHLRNEAACNYIKKWLNKAVCLTCNKWTGKQFYSTSSKHQSSWMSPWGRKPSSKWSKVYKDWTIRFSFSKHGWLFFFRAFSRHARTFNGYVSFRNCARLNLSQGWGTHINSPRKDLRNTNNEVNRN